MSGAPSSTVVFETVRELLVAVLSVNPQAVVPEARVLVELGAESIDLLDMRFRIEKAFGIAITDQDLAAAFGRVVSPEEFHARFTVGALCGYVEQRLARAGEPPAAPDRAEERGGG